MARFFISLTFVLTAALAIFYLGDAPARRYSGESCPYNMIFGSGAREPIGLVTVGGSRVLVATSARDFNPILKRTHPNALTVHNLAHSRYSLEKEYILLRDLLERRSAKAALIMIKPRGSSYGSVHPDYVKIAKLKDIPTTLEATWQESAVEALSAVRDIFWEHIAFFDRTDGKLHPQETSIDCDRIDNRLNVPVLSEGTRNFPSIMARELKWDLSAPEEAGFMRWMEAYRSLSKKHGVEFFFLLMSGMTELLPAEGMEEAFEKATGMHLITLPEDMQRKLSPGGRRDTSHINKIGRDVFLPWLIKRIDEKCTRPDGCF